MKKILALLLTIVLLMTAVVACSNSDDDDDKDDRKSKTEKTEKEDTEEDDDEEEEEEEKKESKGKITFEGLTVVDNDECSIEITKIDSNSNGKYELKVKLQNKSSDKNYMFSVKRATVDGVEADPFFASEVAAGRKEVTGITFDKEELEEYGVKEFTDIQLLFRVYDSDDWSADDVVNELVHVYPYGEDKAEKFVRKDKSSDTVLVDNDYVKVVVIGCEEDKDWGRYYVNMYLENKTDKALMFADSGIAVNGYEVNGLFTEIISPESCGFTNISISFDELEESDIETVEEMEIDMRIYDSDHWSADNILEETFTFEP